MQIQNNSNTGGMRAGARGEEEGVGRYYSFLAAFAPSSGGFDALSVEAEVRDLSDLGLSNPLAHFIYNLPKVPTSSKRSTIAKGMPMKRSERAKMNRVSETEVTNK